MISGRGIAMRMMLIPASSILGGTIGGFIYFFTNNMDIIVYGLLCGLVIGFGIALISILK